VAPFPHGVDPGFKGMKGGIFPPAHAFSWTGCRWPLKHTITPLRPLAVGNISGGLVFNKIRQEKPFFWYWIFMNYRVSSYRWVIVSLLSLSYLLVYVHRMCPAVLVGDLIRSFNASGAVAGLMASAYFYPYALMQVPVGIIADKLGARLLVTICMCMAAVGSLLFSMADSVTTAFFSRVLVGLGVSAVLVPTYKALTAWFPSRQYVMAASLVLSIAGLGGVVAGSPLAWISEWIGWRSSFQVLAGLTFLNGLLVWLFVRNKPQDFGLSPAEPELKEPGLPLQRPAAGKTIGMILANRDFRLLAVWFFLNGGVMFSFVGLWAGPYFIQVYGMSKTSAGSVINLFSLGWVFGPILFGWLATRFNSHGRILGLSMSALAALTLWLLVRNGSMCLPEIYAYNLLFGLVGAGPAGVCFAGAKERFPVQIAGTVTGLIYVFPMAGSAMFQPLAGAILDRCGNLESGLSSGDFSALFLLYFVSCCLAGAAGFMLRRENPSGRLKMPASAHNVSPSRKVCAFSPGTE